ncbi:MAG: prolyl oligopeptidase family serine peptidase [Flavobacteriaceae bacterium]
MKSLKKLSVFISFFILSGIYAQIDLNYQTPHQDILSLADATMPPTMSINNDGSHAILIYRNQYISIEELSEKELRLAGLRINPKTNSSSRARSYTKISLFDLKTKKERAVTGLPVDAKITNINWSNNQDKVAFINATQNGVALWVIDMKTGKATQLTEDNLNANMGNPATWLKDDSSLIVKVLPSDKQNLIDTENAVPTGPTISVNEEGQKAQNRTYQDLLKNTNDEANFETLVRSELWKVTLDGKKTKWKDAALYRSISPSPDGSYFLITEINRPFSYIVTYTRFPTAYNIYDKNGTLVKNLVDVPLIEELPKGFMAVQTGPRRISWRDDQPSTLVWAEALDGGDPETEVSHRDKVMQLQAPFTGNPKQIAQTKLRYSGIEWGKENLAILNSYWWNTRTARTEFFNPAAPSEEPVLFSERNYQDRYSDPGSFVTSRNEYGRNVLEIKDENLYLIGDGFSPEGKLPFVDRYSLRENKTERLYQAENGEMLESISRMMDVEKGSILTRLESSNEFPNYYLRNIKTGTLEQLSSFENPFKAIQDVQKEVITYKRDDGLELSATLYLPVDYEQGKKYPMLMWAYPREFVDAASASQVTSSSNEFTYPYYGSPLYWVNRGYVVLDDAAFPVIGEDGEQPNDTFKEQLVANAKAAIDAVDNLGYIDRNRVAVGGHSYGAFMTANLLSHSNLFAAGIARSGAYNRTLTPFGFQAEERNYWEAPEIYYGMSPFMHADKMKTPLLLIHGEADNNSGTYPMQSERYFNALKGLGAPVRLVMLPNESHGYAARESIMHMLWEQDEWLETHVKNKKD